MHFGLSIENRVISAAIVTNGGVFACQNNSPVERASATALLTSCNALIDMESRDTRGLN